MKNNNCSKRENKLWKKIINSKYCSNYISRHVKYQKWYKRISFKNKLKYMIKLKNIIRFKGKLPTTQNILDLNIDASSKKSLLIDRINLYEEICSSNYSSLCTQYAKKYHYLVNNQKHLKNMNKIEKNLKKTNTVDVTKEKILTSNFDLDTKSIIYNNYMSSLNDTHEFHKYKKWIDTILDLPTKPKVKKNGTSTNFFTNCKKILDEKIYGMSDVKEELLCMLAANYTNSNSKLKAVGLVGPPGIGKTLIVSAIAEILELPIEMISLGGATDSSFLDGHSFTYIGSEPGYIVKAITKMKSTTGIIYFDEIDKISKTEYGKELEHSLLHITDFTQNHDFRDKYIPEIPINLSNYIFIYSMNNTAPLDSALLSRIPIIKIKGYNLSEKTDIVKNYLLPELLKQYNFDKSDIILNEEVIRYLVLKTAESENVDNNGRSGIRETKNILNRILSRINLFHQIEKNNEKLINLPFKIPNFNIPCRITEEMVDQISKKDDTSNSFYMMYT